MNLSRALRLALFEWRITSSEPANIILPLVTPLVFLVFLVPSMQAAARAGGYPEASGGDIAIPFVAALFGFYTVNNVGLAFFREHGWATWDRLRTLPLGRVEIALAKMAVPAVVAVAQLVVLLFMGQIAFGVHVTDNLPAVLVVVVPLVLLPLGLGLLVSSVTSSMPSANALGVLGLMTLIGIGGGFSPTELLPSWSRTLAQVSPVRWVIDVFADALTGGAGLGDVVARAVAPSAVGVLLVVLGILALDPERSKKMWA